MSIADAAFVARQAELIGSRLSFPAIPKPGEGFADLVFRACSENGYFSHKALIQLLGLSRFSSATHLSFSTAKIDPHIVADVFGIQDVNLVLPLLSANYQSNGPSVDFFGREVRKKTFFEKSRRVSPRSLQRDSYQKAIWNVRGITFDPATRERLLAYCPVCSSALSFAKTYGVEYCPECFANGVRVDFRDFPQELVTDDDEALAFATSLIDPEISLTQVDLRRVPKELAGFGPGALFGVISSMARFNNFCTSGRDRVYDTSLGITEPQPSELAAAARAFLSWPNGFFDYVEQLRTLYSRKQFEFRKSSGPANALWQHPMEWFLESSAPALKHILMSRAKEQRVKRLYISLSELIAPDGGKVAGGRSEYKGINSLNKGRSGHRQVYATLDQCLQDGSMISSHQANYLMVLSSRSCREFSKRTGIPVQFLSDIIRAGLIEPLDNDLKLHLWPSNLTYGGTFEERLSKLTCRGTIPVHAMSVVDFVASRSKRRVNPWPTTLSYIFEGRVKMWLRRSRSLGLLENLMVSEFSDFAPALLSIPESLGLEDLPIADRVITNVLGVSRPASVALRNYGWLSEANLTMSDLWSFREEYISIPEIQRRLAMCGEYIHHISLNLILDRASIPIAGEKAARGLGAVRSRRVVENHFGNRLATRM